MIGQFILKIDIENDAFQPEPLQEIARILNQIKFNLLHYDTKEDLTEQKYARDFNGNVVAKYWIQESTNGK